MRQEPLSQARVADSEGANRANRIRRHAILDPNIMHLTRPFICIEAADCLPNPIGVLANDGPVRTNSHLSPSWNRLTR
jgi:hypothetical protein